MTLAQLKQLYRIGELTGARITPNADNEGYLLVVTLRSGQVIPMIKTRTANDNTHALRVFSSLDGAWASACEVGFETVTIVAKNDEEKSEAFTLK